MREKDLKERERESKKGWKGVGEARLWGPHGESHVRDSCENIFPFLGLLMHFIEPVRSSKTTGHSLRKKSGPILCVMTPGTKKPYLA